MRIAGRSRLLSSNLNSEQLSVFAFISVRSQDLRVDLPCPDRRWKLARSPVHHHPSSMSTREAVQSILQTLPPEVSLHEVAREIEFIAGVRDGLAELDRGEGVPVDDLRRELREWAKN